MKRTIQKALKLSINQGYDPVPGAKVFDISVVIQTPTASYITFYVRHDDKEKKLLVGLNDVLFDHNFAKSIWGKEYKKHLKRLVTLDNIKDRLTYIGSTM